MVKYVATSSQISAELGGNSVILHTDVSEYFGLNEVGSSVWSMILEQPRSISELVNEITELYDVDYEQCYIDVNALIQKLQEESLVETR
jgi:hypothetical protein